MHKQKMLWNIQVAPRSGVIIHDPPRVLIKEIESNHALVIRSKRLSLLRPFLIMLGNLRSGKLTSVKRQASQPTGPAIALQSRRTKDKSSCQIVSGKPEPQRPCYQLAVDVNCRASPVRGDGYHRLLLAKDIVNLHLHGVQLRMQGSNVTSQYEVG